MSLGFGPIADAPVSAIGFSGAAAAATGAKDAQRVVRFGPPVPGAPWADRRFETKIRDYTTTAVVVEASSSSTPRQARFGPPIPGAPWNVRRQDTTIHSYATAAVTPQPTVPPAPLHRPEIVIGPPFPGAPWASRKIYTATTGLNPPGPTPPAPTTIRGLPFLERVPDTSGPAGQDRFRRFTELLSICFNSLVRQGILVQTGQTDFTINAAAGSGSGFTGTT